VVTKSRIKELISFQQKKCRETQKCYIAEGIKIINEAIDFHPELVEQVLFTHEAESKLNLNRNINSEKVDQHLIDKISSLKTPQPCLAVLKINSSEKFFIEPADDIILFLDSIRDPGNMGTIIRLADWFGVSKIVCSKDTVDCYNPKVVQASMGAILRLNIYYDDLSRALKNINTNKILIYGATLEGENIYEIKSEFPAIIILGNESEGISKEIKTLITKEINIPNFSSKQEKTESLNVSIATSIILSEFRRFQNYSK
jgi:TrmH family RNA methyltransferase